MTDDQAAENRMLTDRAREKVEAYMRELARPTFGSYVVTMDYGKSGINWQNLDKSEAFNFICLLMIVPAGVLIILNGAFPS